jgi:F0F1-type ATP synthase membrane subunit b/b'
MDKKTQLAWYNKEIGKDKKDIEQHKKHLISQIRKEGLNGVFEKKEVKKDYKVSIWNRILNNLKKRIGF